MIEATGPGLMKSVAAITASFEDMPVYLPDVFSSKVRSKPNRSKVEYSDAGILAGIRERDASVIRFIYRKFFRQVRTLVETNSGTEMDAEDVFQDALMIIYNKTVSGALKLECAFKTYLYSVCHKLWLQQLSRKKTNTRYFETVDEETGTGVTDIDTANVEEQKYRIFLHHFQKLSQADQQVLRLFMKKTSLKEIARIMGYKSEDYAKVRKYISKERLKNAIINDPRYVEIIGHES